MAIATLATEAKATALITECQRALGCGGEISGQFLKNLIDQLESFSVNDTSGRTNRTTEAVIDGRDAAEEATGIGSLATEAKATALLTTCRNALAVGGSIRGQDVKNALDQLKRATTADLSGRTDIALNNKTDGRDTAEAAIADA